MTEGDWLGCTDSPKMLAFLRGRASDRKLRLFMVACVRRFSHLTDDRRVGEAIDIAERFADGLIGDAERSNARKAVQQTAQVRGTLVRRPKAPKSERRVASLAYYAVARDATEAVPHVPELAQQALIWHSGGYDSCDWRTLTPVESKLQSDLLRDIFGNPFRSVTIETSWLTPAVVTRAQGIYDNRDFDRLPSLGDALEEAGCHEADILAHCRGPGPHVRGCWAVDLVLGKE